MHGRFMVGVVAALAACGGGDSGSYGMAEEIGGACVFTPGSYVASYRVLDATSSCSDVEALPDEFITVTDDGFVALAGGALAPAGCVDGDPIVQGCFVAYERVCSQETGSGRVESTAGFQFWYDAGEGEVAFTGRLYAGETLLDTCRYNLGARIRRRR